MALGPIYFTDLLQNLKIGLVFNKLNFFFSHGLVSQSQGVELRRVDVQAPLQVLRRTTRPRKKSGPQTESSIPNASGYCQMAESLLLRRDFETGIKNGLK